MCQECQHWKRYEAFNDRGIDFAPCALKPDRVVMDRRVPGGTDWQAYVTSATFECGSFRSKTEEGTSWHSNSQT